jgi:hypothetical protein
MRQPLKLKNKQKHLLVKLASKQRNRSEVCHVFYSQ